MGLQICLEFGQKVKQRLGNPLLILSCQRWCLFFLSALASRATIRLYPQQFPYSLECRPTPKQLKANELHSIVNDFRLAAHNAIEAGFDGVEINSANSYIIDLFLNDQVNDRTDEYGGSIENRCRVALEIIGAVVEEIGADRVGVKLSVFSEVYGKKDSNPEALMTYLASELTKLGVLYLHVFEPRDEPCRLKSIRRAFEGTLIASGGYNKTEDDEAIAESYADLVSFGR